jgi:AraC-like DNA-binding protein
MTYSSEHSAMQDSLVQPRSRRSVARAHAADSATASVSVRMIHPFARYIRRRGLDADALLHRHGLTAEDLGERDRRVPWLVASALLDDAMRLSGEPAIGIHAAHCDEPGDFGVLEYAAANCATVGEALQLAARYIPLSHDGIFMSLDIVPPLAALRVRTLAGLQHAPAALEFLFALLLTNGSRSIGHATRPRRVDFTHAAPADTRIYEDTFREVRFGCDSNAMWIPTAALDLPHRAPDRSLLPILTSYADVLLRQVSRPHGFAERARSVIAQDLLHSSLDEVAHKLAVSHRTLNRKLQDEGTSHRELVDEVRREQAKLHLAADPNVSIGEISFLLGFAHPNAFHKAFKRWTRMTPAQYREQAHSSARR